MGAVREGYTHCLLGPVLTYTSFALFVVLSGKGLALPLLLLQDENWGLGHTGCTFK